MDKFKECLINEIKALKSSLQMQNFMSKKRVHGDEASYNTCIKLYNEYLNHHPDTIRISEIVERLKKEFIDNDIYYNFSNNAIVMVEKGLIYRYIYLKDNIIFSFDNSYNSHNYFSGWLYQLWIDQTEIIIDEVSYVSYGK